MFDNTHLATALLEPLETTVVAGSAAPAAIRDFFKSGNGVRFSSIFGEFKSRFFDKIEKARPDVAYRKYRLLSIAPDSPIISELGGEDQVEGSVAAALALVRQQGRGERGFLQTNGYANIFYARDRKGALCAIRIGWAEDGWVLDAIPVKDPVAWNGKHEIFCPVSGLTAG
jgi:hypothetical protein